MAKRRFKWEDMWKMPAKDRLLQRLRYTSDDPQDAWNEFATLHAEDRHKNDFATRRGYFIIPDLPTSSGKAFCLFDNRPYTKADGGNRRREKLMELYRQKLKDAGINELGYGTYPPPGAESAGYTSAIMLDADDSKTQIIVDGFHQSVRETDERHTNARDEEEEVEHKQETLETEGVEASANEGSALPDLVNVGQAGVSGLLPEEVAETPTLFEGAVRKISVNAYERNPVARQHCIAAHGTTCCICGFNFGAVYGPEAEGYIHVHHLRALSEADGEYVVDPIEDLRPVCPNCHAVLHLGGECRSIDEVRKMVKDNKG